MALSLLSKKPIFTIAVGTTAALLTGTTLYAFELNNLVNDAQSQIQSLSKQISNQESSERKKLTKLTDYQVNTNETLNKLSEEISKARTDLEMAYLKKEGAIRDVLEEDFRRTLKILTAAHSDHLNDKLKQQYNSLNEEFQNVLDEQIRLHKNKYCEELKASVFKLYELEKTLKTRKDLDEQELKSRKLWVLCQSIKDVLKNPFGSVPSVEIQKQVENFSKIANALKDDSLLQNVLSSLIKTTKENTVYSEDTLLARFKNVDKLCRRVALVKEDNASITKYFLSYIQSMLVIDNFKIDPDEVNGVKVVDVNRFNTFSILARMKYCLDNKKFEECLKYANLLKGAPKRIASEWIKDLTTHLEVRQAADILEAQTASYTIRSIN